MRAATPRNASKGRFEKAFAGSGLEARWTKSHKGDREAYPNAARVDTPREAAAQIFRVGRRPWRRRRGRGRLAGGMEAFSFRTLRGCDRRRRQAGRTGRHGRQQGGRHPFVGGRRRRSGSAAWAPPLHAANGRWSCCPMSPMRTSSMLALALGRHSQRISIVKALADGVATRVRTHLDTTLRLEPRHAEAHIALGLYHAEIVAKIGPTARRPHLSGVPRNRDGSASVRPSSSPPVHRSRRSNTPTACCCWMRKVPQPGGRAVRSRGRHRAGRRDGAARCRARAALPSLRRSGKPCLKWDGQINPRAIRPPATRDRPGGRTQFE